MTHAPYPYKLLEAKRYIFISDGKKRIAKVVDFMPLKTKNFMNLSTQHPEIAIFFAGSTDDRTKLYNRILKTYYPIFSKEFAIAGVIDTDNDIQIVPYDPKSDHEYLAFLIKKFINFDICH